MNEHVQQQAPGLQHRAQLAAVAAQQQAVQQQARLLDAVAQQQAAQLQLQRAQQQQPQHAQQFVQHQQQRQQRPAAVGIPVGFAPQPLAQSAAYMGAQQHKAIAQVAQQAAQRLAAAQQAARAQQQAQGTVAQGTAGASAAGAAGPRLVSQAGQQQQRQPPPPAASQQQQQRPPPHAAPQQQQQQAPPPAAPQQQQQQAPPPAAPQQQQPPPPAAPQQQQRQPPPPAAPQQEQQQEQQPPHLQPLVTATPNEEDRHALQLVWEQVQQQCEQAEQAGAQPDTDPSALVWQGPRPPVVKRLRAELLATAAASGGSKEARDAVLARWGITSHQAQVLLGLGKHLAAGAPQQGQPQQAASQPTQQPAQQQPPAEQPSLQPYTSRWAGLRLQLLQLAALRRVALPQRLQWSVPPPVQVMDQVQQLVDASASAEQLEAAFRAMPGLESISEPRHAEQVCREKCCASQWPAG